MNIDPTGGEKRVWKSTKHELLTDSATASRITAFWESLGRQQPSPMSVGSRTAYAACSTSFATIFTHGSPASTVDNPDSAILLPCSSGATLECSKYLKFIRLPAEDDTSSAVALAPRAVNAFVSGRSGFAVLVSLTEDAAKPRTFRPFDNAVVAHAVFDSSGGLLALAPASGSIRVYDADAMHVTHAFALRQDLLITSICFHPDTSTMLLFVGCEDGSIHCFDLATRAKKPVFSVNHHVSAVVSFAFANSGRWLIAASTDRVLSVSKSRNGENLHLLVADESLIGVESFPCVKNAVVTLGERGVLRVWDVGAGTELLSLATAIPLVTSVSPGSGSSKDAEIEDDAGIVPTHVTGLVQSGERQLTISLTDQTVITYSEQEDGKLCLTHAVCGNIEQVNDLRVVPAVNDHGFINSSIPDTCLPKDEGLPHMMIASNSNVIWVMEPPAGSLEAQKPQNDAEGSPARTALKGEPPNDVDLAANQGWTCKEFLSGHRGIVLALDSVCTTENGISPLTGESTSIVYVASASRDKTARIWTRSNSGSWKCIGVAEGHTDAVTAVALSPRSQAESFFAVTGANDRTLKLWPLQKSVVNAGIDCQDEGDTKFVSVNQAPLIRARHAVSTHLKQNDLAKYLELEKDDLLLSAKWTVLAHEKDINSVSISPDAKLIATGSQDKTVKLWDSIAGTLKQTFRGHKRGVFDVAFSPVDKVIASASGDGTVRVWDAGSGSCLRTLEGHVAGVLKALFMTRGTQLASSGMDGLLKIWTVRTGEVDVTLDAHDDNVWALDVARDGASLVSGGMDGVVHIWNDNTQVLAAVSADKKDEEALLSQRVNDSIRRRQWAPAADAALHLNIPRKMKGVIVEIITTTENVDEELRNMITALSKNSGYQEKMGRLLSYCRDWNAAGGASSAAVAARVLQAIFSLWSPSRLCDEITVDKRGLVEALVAHTDRHHTRVASLIAKAHFVDYTLTAMRGLGDATVKSHFKKGTENRKRNVYSAASGTGGDALKRRKKGHAGEATAY
jgi:U3 small nucleolar RNA-associated protein 13